MAVLACLIPLSIELRDIELKEQSFLLLFLLLLFLARVGVLELRGFLLKCFGISFVTLSSF